MSVKQVLITVFFLFLFASASGQVLHALLIAVDKYPADSGWNEIHATNDLNLIKPVLIKQGYLQKNIATLTNEQATKGAIVEALKRLARDSDTSDRIYIHFSCHGQQMADNDTDETDGLDEALIPYDAQRRYRQGIYEGENHLRDDELGRLLDAIRRKVGRKGSLIMTLDACHSGTADRDYTDAYLRGTTYIFAPPNFVHPQADSQPFLGRIASHPQMATLTVIAACHPHELNYEYRCPLSDSYYGSLSFALSRIWQNDNSFSIDALRTALSEQMTQLKSRRGRIQTPLLQTSDEKSNFKIGL